MKHGREIRRGALAAIHASARLAPDGVHDEIRDLQAATVRGLGHEITLNGNRQLTILGATQPDRIALLLGPAHNGMAPRFLWRAIQNKTANSYVIEISI